ncbi:hypothetical protein D3C77_676670 [compost metagenome]
MRANHMYAQNIVRLSVSDHLNEAFLLSEYKRFSYSLERNFTCLNIMTLRARTVLG